MLEKIDSLALPNTDDKNAYTTTISVSPSGKYVATIVNDYQIIIYECGHDTGNNTGSFLKQFKQIHTDHTQGINELVWSPDSQCIATCSDDCSIEITHIKLGKLQTLMGHTAPVITIKYSPKGNLLFSGSMDESIKIWNVGVSGIVPHKDTGLGDFLLTAPMKTMSAHSDPVVTLDIPTFDSSIIASGSYDGLIRIFDTKSGHCLKTLTYDKDWANDDGVLAITNVKFSYNGKYLLVKSMDGVLKLWNYITGKVVRTFIPDEAEDVAMDCDNEVSMEGTHSTGMSFLYPQTGSPLVVDGTENGQVFVFDVNSKNTVDRKKISSTSCIIDIAVYKQTVYVLTLNGNLEVFNWVE